MYSVAQWGPKRAVSPWSPLMLDVGTVARIAAIVGLLAPKKSNSFERSSVGGEFRRLHIVAQYRKFGKGSNNLILANEAVRQDYSLPAREAAAPDLLHQPESFWGPSPRLTPLMQVSAMRPYRKSTCMDRSWSNIEADFSGYSILRAPKANACSSINPTNAFTQP